MHGVVDHLTTEISTSRQKKFPLINFIDTPGLVDGDTRYSFDMNQAIMQLGDVADLIFVLFDPIGQALCKRTMNIVEALNDRFPDKMHFYLSKSDDAGPETDRQKVLTQLVHEMCKRPGLAQRTFDIPTIYLPQSATKTVPCINQIDETCRTMERAIGLSVQSTLNALEKDSQLLDNAIIRTLNEDDARRRSNQGDSLSRLALWSVGFFAPFLVVVSAFLAMQRHLLVGLLGESLVEVLETLLYPALETWSYVPAQLRLPILAVLLFGSVLCLWLAQRRSRRLVEIMSSKERSRLGELRKHLQGIVERRNIMMDEYLLQSVGDYAL